MNNYNTKMLPLGAWLLAAYLAIGAVSCQEASVTQELSSEAQTALDRVAQMRVFFGHQSVGANILDGLAGLQEMGLPIVDVREEGAPGGAVPEPGKPAVLHAYIGRNTHPGEKVADFAELIRSGIAETADVSFMKFCYVDSGKALSAREIFDRYITEMERLEAEYPGTTFVYLTMPLTAPQRSIKNLIKRILGMPLYMREDNIERQVFNDLLREAKGDTGRLFDIARIESTHPDGSRETFTTDGVTYEVLVPAYTYDGGHLNELGRRVVAEELVLFLASLDAR